jgi:hypothetical protein
LNVPQFQGAVANRHHLSAAGKDRDLPDPIEVAAEATDKDRVRLD